MGEDVHLPFWAWLIAPNLMISGCIHFPTDVSMSLAQLHIPHCMCVLHFPYPRIQSGFSFWLLQTVVYNCL